MIWTLCAGLSFVAAVASLTDARTAEPKPPPAGEARLLSEISLEKEVGRGLAPVGEIQSIRFSPAGETLALLVRNPDLTTDVVVKTLFQTGSTATRTSLGEPAIVSMTNPGLWWSPDGQVVAVRIRRGIVFMHRSGGVRCSIATSYGVTGGFLGNSLFLSVTYDRPSNPRALVVPASTVSIFRLDCGLEATWKYRGMITSLAVAPTSGLLAMDVDEGRVMLVSAFTGRPIREFAAHGSRAALRFGDAERLLCFGGYPPTGRASCFDVMSGKPLARQPTVKGGAPMDAAVDAPVVLFTEGTHWRNPLTESERSTLRSWLVWNCRDGRVLARLNCREQERAAGAPGKLPYATAISPDGRVFAAAGEGRLMLYAIAGP